MDLLKDKMKGDHIKRMQAVLIHSQSDALLKAVYSVWHELLSNSKNQHQVDAMVQAMRGTNIKKMVAMMAGSSDKTLLKTIMSGWHELVVVAKRDRGIELLNSKKQATTKRMLLMLTNSKSEVVLKTTFIRWRDDVREIAKARIATQSREMQHSLRKKGEESSKRMLAMLLGSQEGMLLKTTFSAWRDSRLSTVQTGKLEYLREVHLKYRMQTVQKSKTMLQKLFGSQGHLITLSSFTMWRDMIKELKKENELVRLKEANMAARLKSAHCAKKAFAALAGTKIDIIIKTVFAAWREMFLEMQLELQVSKLKEENLRLMLAVCEQETELTKLQEAHQELVKMSYDKEVRMTENIMKLKLSSNLKEQRIITQAFGAQGMMLMKVMFSAWRDFRTDAMLQNEKSEMARLRSQSMATKSKKDVSAQRMLMKLVGSEKVALLKVTMNAWREVYFEFRKDVEHAQLKEENLRMMLAVCEQESEMTRLKEEVCRLMEENLEAAKETRKLREEGLHYAQQCRQVINTTQPAEGNMWPRVAALTNLLSTQHDEEFEQSLVLSPSPRGAAPPGPLASLLARVDAQREARGGASPSRGGLSPGRQARNIQGRYAW